MEQYTIKKAAFGGFDREDVARYIEKLAGEMEQLRAERDELREQLGTLEGERDKDREALREATAQCDKLRSELDAAQSARAEADELRAKVAALLPDAEAHAAIKEKLGEIECSARERAAALERRTAEQLKMTADQFREQYRQTVGTLETAAAHVTAELRKAEVVISQLPRAMDQTGSEINALSALLDQTGRADGQN